MVGALGGSVSGITSGYQYIGGSEEVWAYTMTEISEEEYNDPSYLFWYEDDNNALFIDSVDFEPSNDGYTNAQNIYIFSNQFGFNKAFFNVAANCAAYSGYCASNNVTISPAPGSSPASPYTTGITINITDTGWIKYDTATETKYTYFGSLGNADIPDCADCTTIRTAFPFADLATWTVVDCGSPC
jgi:hypothetical protein